jgi:hypothetical protein
MKTLFGFFLILSFTAFAGNKNPYGYERFYNTYGRTEGVINFRIPKLFLQAFIEQEDQDTKDFMNKIDDISLFITDESRAGLLPELKKHLPESTYHDVMIIRDGASVITIKVRGKEPGIDEFLMVVEEENSFVVLFMSGKFSHDDITELAHSIDMGKAMDMQ